jgi:hypothetical protein
MKTSLRLALFLVLPALAVGESVPDATLRADALRLLEQIEQTRLLLGITMGQVHELRNLALYSVAPGSNGLPPLAEFEALDRESLRLYETIKPVDYAASSLFSALDVGDTNGLAEDLAFLKAELGTLAPQVLKHYRAVSEKRLAGEVALCTASDRPRVVPVPGKPWVDPVRERQRKIGAQVGWRTNLEPEPDFRETFWNRTQGLDIRYQLAKGRMLGVDFIVPKDPLLRWDWLEPEKGRYDFSRLDRAMALAAEYGLKVKLVLPTMGGRVPDWLVAERPESVIRNASNVCDFAVNPGAFAHDFMGPVQRTGTWYQARAVNLEDEPTRKLFARYVEAVADHCREAGYADRILLVTLDLFHAQRHWRLPPGANEREYIAKHYRAAGRIAREAFRTIPTDLEVSDGEAHGIDYDRTAHEWRSLGLTGTVSVPGVASETPFFEDLMRAVAWESVEDRSIRAADAGPFFYQNCEYGFGCMLSINFFTALLRDGLWSDGWFGPEGPLRWGYFPQVMTWNDRQLQWSGILNGYLAFQQAHRLSPTIANTRVGPADVLLLLPSSSMDLKEYRTHRELVGWGWALTALKIPYDVITEKRLAEGVPGRARLLILPQAAALNKEHVRAVRTFVANGGLLLSSLVPAWTNAGPSALTDVIGCDVARTNGVPVLLTQTGVKGTAWQMTVNRGLHSGKYTPVPPLDEGYPRKVEGRRVDCGQPYQALWPRGKAQVLYEFGTGQPAVVGHRFAKGRAFTFGYPFGNELVFADWTSIAFGKIYNGWARDEQMLGMLRMLKGVLEQLGYPSGVGVPEGWRHRLQGFEAAVSSLAYPKGAPAALGVESGAVLTYLDPDPARAIRQDHDELDYAMELTWRERPGLATRYLAVGNRESAYAGERAVVQFWMMPHIVRIRIADPAVRAVVDVVANVPVRLERDAEGVSFFTSVPPALGRVFAVSTNDTVELFEPAVVPGVTPEEVAAAVAAIAPPAGAWAAAQVFEAPAIQGWLAARGTNAVAIAYGDEAYRPAAERLAAWLREAWKLDASATAEDGRYEVQGNEKFQVVYQPTEAAIWLGNAWANNAVACLDCTWPYNSGAAPALHAGRFTATRAWPGGERGVVALTREWEFRRGDHTTWGTGYGNTEGYAPRRVESAPRPYLRRHLLVLASTPEGAVSAVEALKANGKP